MAAYLLQALIWGQVIFLTVLLYSEKCVHELTSKYAWIFKIGAHSVLSHC